MKIGVSDARREATNEAESEMRPSWLDCEGMRTDHLEVWWCIQLTSINIYLLLYGAIFEGIWTP